jgi:hypothetical protein
MLSALPGVIRLKNGHAQDDADSCEGCHKSCSTMGARPRKFYTHSQLDIRVRVPFSKNLYTLGKKKIR